MPIRLLIASNNKYKIQEFRTILEPRQFELVAPSELGIALDVEETGATFEDNARLKAQSLRPLTDLPIISDDSGLEIDALGGEPGIYSARYAGDESTVEGRIQLVLRKMWDVPDGRRTARFTSAVALSLGEQDLIVVRGEVEGLIMTEPRGVGGFGYDPIFYYPPMRCTFAEMVPTIKARVSHRGKALSAAAQFLVQRL